MDANVTSSLLAILAPLRIGEAPSIRVLQPNRAAKGRGKRSAQNPAGSNGKKRRKTQNEEMKDVARWLKANAEETWAVFNRDDEAITVATLCRRLNARCGTEFDKDIVTMLLVWSFHKKFTQELHLEIVGDLNSDKTRVRPKRAG